MFETVVPESFAKKSRRIFYETLPVSVALHAIVVAGCLVAAGCRGTSPDPRVDELKRRQAEVEGRLASI
ncbi:MAG TPA: hypothetical protein VJ276_05525, partial [Thermoanaerobaculia bacterium]|nr:hypothetical protein [Thermoanaerobaculia bacterium]